jgi:drug/metabolite transporter (DMT)-like permease
VKVLLYTTFALVAFAFNSILCRLALRGGEIDAAGFTLVRLASGAAALVILAYFFSSRKEIRGSGNWLSAFFLFAYAICFSFAYLGLTAGTGALVLFGAVQITMIGVSIFRGEHPSGLEWVGVLFAVGGLVHLVLPGLAAPPLFNAGLMAAAGIAWGFYTLRGKSSGGPLADTTGNFVRSVPMIVLAAIPFFSRFHLSSRGVLLAATSGAVTSGIGYAVWYAALKHHNSTRAAVLQLSVPVIAAAIGVWLLSETADMRLIIAGALILGGIGLTIFGRKS